MTSSLTPFGIFLASRHLSKNLVRSLSTNANKTRIGIIGSGAVGSYYGARLWENNNHQVSFLMRGEHLDACRSEGLQIKSIRGDIFIPPCRETFCESPEEIGNVDWVIVALKSTALPLIPDLSRPLLREDGETKMVAVMNGLVERDVWNHLQTSKCFVSALYGGMAFAGINRVAPGVVDHRVWGLLTLGVANSKDAGQDHQQLMRNLWKDCNQEISWENSLLRGRWKKNVWNLAFSGLSVAMGGITVDKIVEDPELRQTARKIMEETVMIGNADLRASHEKEDAPLGEEEINLMMQSSDTMGAYKPSTMLDFVNRKPMEVKYIFREALDRGHALGLSVPNLESVVIQIEMYQEMYRLY